MFGMSWVELFIVLVVALLVIGPDKLPEVARGLGRLIRQFQKIINEVRNSVDLDDFDANIRESSHYNPPIGIPNRPNIPNPILPKEDESTQGLNKQQETTKSEEINTTPQPVTPPDAVTTNQENLAKP